MELRAAVQTAKDFVRQIYADEDITAVGLEELERDDDLDIWAITIGFNSRNGSDAAGRAARLQTLTGMFYGDRRFKVVRFRDDGSLISIKDRILEKTT